MPSPSIRLRHLRAPALACLLAWEIAFAAPACSRPTSSPSLPSSSGAISGRERIGWSQQAPDDDELARYTFVIYVDGVAVVLPNVTCGAMVGEGASADCSSALPSLSPGPHTLELAARVAVDAGFLESDRSAPLVVTVAGLNAVALERTVIPGILHTDNDVVVERVVSGVDAPAALARLPDGRLVIADRRGGIQIAAIGQPLDAAAIVRLAAAIESSAGPRLAVSADFPATHFVYVGYVARDSDGTSAGRVVRLREVGGTLGEPAVIVDGLPTHSTPPRARIGSDGILYVGTSAEDARDADSLGSYAGKILRFTSTGSTPADNPFRFSPVFSLGYPHLVDFDWEPTTRRLWYAESDAGGVAIGQAAASRSADPVAYFDGLHATAVAFHAGAEPAAWRNSLFLASADQDCLYRVVGLSTPQAKPSVERLFAGRYGRIAAVVSGDDGLYFAAESVTGDLARSAAVFRVRDQRASADVRLRRAP